MRGGPFILMLLGLPEEKDLKPEKFLMCTVYCLRVIFVWGTRTCTWARHLV